MKRFVYLAGPILDCTEGQANAWRKTVSNALDSHSDGGIVGISPLRCEPIHGPVYAPEYADEKFGTPRAIMNKNMFDVQNCDMVLAYLPTPPAGRKQSWGTIIEIAWAHALGKRVVLVSDDPAVHAHPVLDGCCGWKLERLADGVDTIVGILGGYVGGKNV